MDHCRLFLLLLFLAAGPAGCGTDAPGDDDGPGPGCQAGSVRACGCGDGYGIQQCLLNGQWGDCLCGDAIPEDVTIPDPDVVVPPDEPLPTAPPKGATELTGAGMGLKSEHYRLQLVIGASRPLGQGSSEHYRVRLGPALGNAQGE